MKLHIRLKGGAGSGNFGHSGRPGLVGGSDNDYTGNAGYITQRHNPLNGADYVLYNAEEAALDTASGKWATVCEKHNTICNHSTKKLALSHLPDGDWCEECMAEMDN